MLGNAAAIASYVSASISGVPSVLSLNSSCVNPYPLIEAPDAVRELERGHARGKIVVTV